MLNGVLDQILQRLLQPSRGDGRAGVVRAVDAERDAQFLGQRLATDDARTDDVDQRLLREFHRLVGNWGIAIILLTFLVKAAFFPLTQRSFKSMQRMQQIQPELAKIKEQYADNPQEMNQRTLALMKEHNISGIPVVEGGGNGQAASEVDAVRPILPVNGVPSG